ncbi:STAS domain-containing protein [bacterium]|nr:STAS domain-containing protein [bacterium]
MTYSYEATDGLLLFTVSGELTMYNIAALLDGIERACGEQPSRNVLICGQEIDLIDSAAFGMLVKRHARLLQEGGRICFTELRANVASALRQLHLDETLRHFAQRSEALGSSSSFSVSKALRGRRTVEL